MSVVTASWLKEQIDNNNSNIVVLDVTWYSARDAEEDYLKKHIPGSTWFNIMKDVDNSDMYPRNLPDPEVFECQARAVGVNKDSHVVLYDDTPLCGFFVGSRCWWMFKFHGHENVSIVDGGLTSWEAAGYPVTAGVTQVKEGNFEVNLSPSWRRSHEDMVADLEYGKNQVCDTRPADKYRGDPADAKTGHYPSAVSMTLATVLINKENNRLHSVEKLQQIFKDRGVDIEKPVVTMCGSGMSSCTAALAATLCGASNVSVYMGGFTEWSRKADDGQIEQTATSKT